MISDLAYAEIYFGDAPTPSILQVPGAKEVAVEFTSMSKTYSMAGWRIGFAVGNPGLIGALARVKSYLDYGAFTPVQAAAVAALNGPQDIVEANRRSTSRGATAWSNASAAPAGTSRRRRRACSPGRRSPSRSAASARWSSPSGCSPRRRSRSARDRLRRGRRRLRPHRPGRERADPGRGAPPPPSLDQAAQQPAEHELGDQAVAAEPSEAAAQPAKAAEAGEQAQVAEAAQAAQATEAEPPRPTSPRAGLP